MDLDFGKFRALTEFLKDLYRGKSIEPAEPPHHPRQSIACRSLVRINQSLATLGVTNHQIVAVASDLTESRLQNPSTVTSMNFLAATNPRYPLPSELQNDDTLTYAGDTPKLVLIKESPVDPTNPLAYIRKSWFVC